MSSAKRVLANRANGRKSQGPKTLAGKMRSRRNAWRHGLSTINRSNGVYAKEIEDIAKAICEPDDHPLLREQAAVIAECEAIIRHVSNQRRIILERELSRFFGDEYAAMRHATPELTRLDRYEHRARSRRKRAILWFNDLRGYLRAIAPYDNSTYDPRTGGYLVSLAEPEWTDQVIDTVFRPRTPSGAT